jgi:ribonuclease D
VNYIQSEDRLAELADRLGDETLLAADTEAAGYHRYFDRACLLQLSTRGETYLVDTLAVTDLTPIGRLLADPEVEVVFHDADYDLRLLDRDFGLQVRGLFDTKIAAQFLGEPAIGLASLMEKYLSVMLDKKYQRADWGQRPLPQELLEYAAQDTTHLPALRDRLRESLWKQGRLAWAEEEFLLQERVGWTPVEDDGEAFLRMKGARDLKPRQLAVLREVHGWREAIARERDQATFRVIGNEALLEIARQQPRTPRDLGTIKGMPRSLAERRGGELLSLVRRALELPEDALPQRRRGPARPPPDAEFEAQVERLKAARDSAADELGLDRGFLMPRAQLEELARARPASLAELAELPGIRRWQVEAAGAAMLAAIRR